MDNASNTMGSTRVLVVDDVIDIVEEMIDMLVLADVRAVGAHTIDQAISALAAHPSITLVISDIRLQHESGLDIPDRVAKDPTLATRALRYVFASGDTEGLARNPADAGHLLLSKPVSPRLLIATIQRLLERDGADT